MISVILILTIIGLIFFVAHLFRSWGRAEKQHKKEVRVKKREEKILEEMFRRDEARQQMAAAYHSHMLMRKEKQQQREMMTQQYMIDQSMGVLNTGISEEVSPNTAMFQAQAPPPPGVESVDLDMIDGFGDPADSEQISERLLDENEEATPVVEKTTPKRRRKKRFIRFTSDGETADGTSEEEKERKQNVEVLRWASNEFKEVFERPPNHLSELLEFLDQGREQSDPAQEGETERE
ncbi:MAG TPA: hypothetical protein QF646_03415 [Candidatus Poseidoniales archaeon]|nr:hypothetical protein [Candidatus Poseidoniales archaeon]